MIARVSDAFGVVGRDMSVVHEARARCDADASLLNARR